MPKPEDVEKFKQIKARVGILMNNPKSQNNQIMRDFEWVIVYATILGGEEVKP